MLLYKKLLLMTFGTTLVIYHNCKTILRETTTNFGEESWPKMHEAKS